MKRSVVNSGFLSPKVEKPTLMVGSLGWSPVRSSVGNKAELAALLSPVLGEGLGQLGQREPVGFLAVDQGFDDVGGQGRQLENAGHIRAIDVEGTGKLADGLDLARFEDVGPGKAPCQRLARLERSSKLPADEAEAFTALLARMRADESRNLELHASLITSDTASG